MALAAGTRVGAYEIVTLLGVGGMGEVYRAHDMRLKRDVAIKILPTAFASDPERLARFQREAEVIALLNHPHIAQIHGLEEVDGIRALVLELVDGDTLAERIAHGPIPIDDALPIARQIVEALEAAHERGIIHRDLKPANIKIAVDGTVKVLDFGLAKLADHEAAGSGLHASGLSHSPTITSPALVTGGGVLLGTAAYMSPEQAKARAVDKRSDLWAFGCVLYEMLTGTRAFPGEDISDTLANILKTEPNWQALPLDTTASIRRLLRRCLEKDRPRRLDSAAAARLEIADALSTPAADATPASAMRGRSNRLAWGVAVVTKLAAVALAIPAVFYLREERPSAPPETRLEIGTGPTSGPLAFALSPDGHSIVYVASGVGGALLWLRSLDSTTAQPLTGTENASFPFWSPDSHSIGFFASGQLKRLDLGGGQPQALASVSSPRGGSWTGDGIVFAPNAASPLLRVTAGDRTPVAVTRLLPGQIGHRFPQFLRGGRQFLYYSTGTANGTRGIYLGSLDTPEAHWLTPSDTAGAYLAPTLWPSGSAREAGWLLWMQDGTLRTQHLDLERGTLTGDPVTLADGVAYDIVTGAGGFSVSATGLIAYRSGAGAGSRQLTWIHRTGKQLGVWGARDQNGMGRPRLSPNGQRVAVDRPVLGNSDIFWLLDGTDIMRRLTFDAAVDQFSVWSPDGGRIVFRSNRTGTYNLYIKAVGGAQAEERLTESTRSQIPTDWSQDGRFLLFFSVDPQSDADLWVLPLTGDRQPWPFLKTPFGERWATFSPNGHWVAYMSNASGQEEIYVRPFAERGSDPGGAQYQVSTAGGNFPAWRADGMELYYLAPDGRMMATTIGVRGMELEPGAPVALFSTRIVGSDTSAGRQYDVARDGRFLINTPVDDTETTAITVVQNWRPVDAGGR